MLSTEHSVQYSLNNNAYVIYTHHHHHHHYVYSILKLILGLLIIFLVTKVLKKLIMEDLYVLI